MPLETGDYISDLVETNPPGTDPVSQGDDHLRLIKHVLKMTFPNVDGPVTSTDEELSNLGQQMPIVTVYNTAAGAQVHTFDPSSSWYEVSVTGAGGGGHAGDGTAGDGHGGSAGGTAIKTAVAPAGGTADFTVGAGGAAGPKDGQGGDGQKSTWTDGTETVEGLGGLGGREDPYTYTGGSATGGDINLQGGMSENGGQSAGGASYWTGAPDRSTTTAAGFYPGAGGRGGQVTSGSVTRAAGAGYPGYIVVKEYA